MPEAAVQRDVKTGIEERLELVATSRGQIYTWVARPPQIESCVLVCSSVFSDFLANYHRERLLGRVLASQGCGVIRFHYTGEGNSQGERRDMTFASMCDDARSALDHAASLGFSNFAVLGTRVGALVAAATVASMPGAPLAFWEPVTNALRFLTEAERAKRMSLVSQGVPEPKRGRHLEENGVLDLLGYDVYPAFVASFTNIDLFDTMGAPPREVLVARFRSQPGATDPISESMIARGFSVETRGFGFTESWWFHDEQEPESGDLISATSSWLTSSLGALR